MYAIVDIETTGGFAGKSKITEIAIYTHDGAQLLDHYHSLINPQAYIPDYITGLTGISAQMVANAPTFSEIAGEVYEQLRDKVFVAHNVHFDYSFLKEAFKREGYTFSPKKLCTVRLSRVIFPGLRSYGLGNLCECLAIPINNRHRAQGDAEATAILFEKLHQKQPEYIAWALKRNSEETTMPPHLDKEEFQALPEVPGVYYFINGNGEVIYVGKAINIKKRIRGHFSGTSKNKRNQYIRNEIHHINYELTGNELVALVLESQEIKRLWPKYNRSQKYISNQWGIYQYEDREGYIRLSISKVTKGPRPLMQFNAHADAWEFMNNKLQRYGLCAKFCGTQKSAGACYDYEVGVCKGACVGEETTGEYNDKVKEAIASFREDDRSFAILGAGRYEGEQSVILIEKGTYHGFGFYNAATDMSTLEQVKGVVDTYKPTAEIEHYIEGYINSSEAQVIELA